MDHIEVFEYISSLFSEREQVKDKEFLDKDIQSAIHSSLFSLYRILDERSLKREQHDVNTTDKDKKISSTFSQGVIANDNSLKFPVNNSEVKPSRYEIIGMCLYNTLLFKYNSPEWFIASLITEYITNYLTDSKKSIVNLDSCIWKLSELLNIEFKKAFACDILKYFYFYLFLIFEKEGLICDNIDNFDPWNKELVNTTIYLPIEGVVNLVFFNFLITPNKKRFSKVIGANDRFNDGIISQYDCGFRGQLPEQLELRKNSFAWRFDTYRINVEEADISKFVNIPLGWLRVFHVVNGEVKYDLHLFKTLKVINDVSGHVDKIWVKKENKISVPKVLANVDEGNFSVRGVWCDNDYGLISTCIRSIIFRDLELNVIDRLEDMHEIVFGHLGDFTNYEFEYLDPSYRKTFLKNAANEISKYKFSVPKIDDAFSQNPLVQLAAWQYVSEYYAYINTELIITQYITENEGGICDESNYFPKEIDTDKVVMFDKNTHLEYFKQNNRPYPKEDLRDYYLKQPVFKEENIDNLIERTRLLILNCCLDQYLKFRGEQCCTLRQFMADSLFLVKARKNQGFLRAVPNYIYYGHDGDHKNDAVDTLISDILDGKKHKLKYTTLISRLMQAQNLVFVVPGFLSERNAFFQKTYSKIQEFMNDQIPLLKYRSKKAAEEIDKELDSLETPYELLVFLKDFTINIIDRLYEQLPNETAPSSTKKKSHNTKSKGKSKSRGKKKQS